MDVGKSNRVERRKQTQNVQEKECPQELAGGQATNGKRNRSERHDNANKRPVVQRIAKQHRCCQGNGREKRDGASQDARFRLWLHTVE